ncbi:hypothetical protein [Micromonospora sp. IBSANI012]
MTCTAVGIDAWERFHGWQINERLRGIHQVLNAWALKATVEGGR